MKVIFLDVDGVINMTKNSVKNSSEFKKQRRELKSKMFYKKFVTDGDSFKEIELGIKDGYIEPLDSPDFSAIKNLNKLIKITGAKVVVSSCWRIGNSIKGLQDTLSFDGVECDVIDMTPRINGVDRGVEIKFWMDNFKGDIDSFVILDDDSDMLPSQMDNFVKCPNQFGFQEKELERALKILGHEVEV